MTHLRLVKDAATPDCDIAYSTIGKKTTDNLLVKDAATLDPQIARDVVYLSEERLLLDDRLVSQYAMATQIMYDKMKLSPQFALRHKHQVQLIIEALQEACDEQ